MIILRLKILLCLESDLSKNIKRFFKSDNCKIKKDDSLNYGIYFNDRKILTMKLKVKKHINKIGIISYDIYDIDEIVKEENNGLYSYEITIPSSYEIYVNNRILSNGEKTQIEGFSDGYNYVTIPVIYKYNVKNL